MVLTIAGREWPGFHATSGLVGEQYRGYSQGNYSTSAHHTSSTCSALRELVRTQRQ